MKNLKRLLSFLPRKDEPEFLLVQVQDDSLSAIRATLSDERCLVFKEQWNEFDPRALVRKPLVFFKKPHVIIAVAPHLVHYAAVPVTWLRGHSLRPIEATEAENIFGQELSKQFNAMREEAARALGAPEAHVILATSRVRDVTVDGHRVADPVGLAVREVRATVDLAFIHRELYETLKPLFTVFPVFFTDDARASLGALAKAYPLPLALLFPSGAYATAHLLREDGLTHIFEKKEFIWSDQEMMHALIAGLGMGATDAEAYYETYVRKEHGKAERLAVEKKLTPVKRSFLSAVSRAKLAGTICWGFRRPMPPLFPRTYRKSTFRDIDVGALLGRVGVSVEPAKWPLSKRDLFLRLAPFIDFHGTKGDLALNRWLKRRLHWLGAAQGSATHGETWESSV